MEWGDPQGSSRNSKTGLWLLETRQNKGIGVSKDRNTNSQHRKLGRLMQSGQIRPVRWVRPTGRIRGEKPLDVSDLSVWPVWSDKTHPTGRADRSGLWEKFPYGSDWSSRRVGVHPTGSIWNPTGRARPKMHMKGWKARVWVLVWIGFELESCEV